MRAITLVAFLCAAALAACDSAQTAKTEEPEAMTAAPEAMQAASAPYVGTWAADAAACAIPQEQQGAPHVFGADTYNQHEAHCTYANVAETGPNSWHIDAACQVEGDEASLGWDLVVEGDTMTMDSAHRLVRCP